MSKKSALVLIVTGSMVYLGAMYSVSLGICNDVSYGCRRTADTVQVLVAIFPFVFLFSLITYKMREEVFQAWWRFAVWFVPVIMVVTYLLYSGHRQSGFGGVSQGAFEFLILVILYAIFILTSLIRIILAHRRFKQ